MPSYVLRYDYIEMFKARHPDHGLPSSLHAISADFDDESGELVELECCQHNEDGTDILLDYTKFDGPALRALIEECRRYGDEC